MMDAYDIQQQIFKAWQQLAHNPNASVIKKNWASVPIYVNDKVVTDVKIEDNKIILEVK